MKLRNMKTRMGAEDQATQGSEASAQGKKSLPMVRGLRKKRLIDTAFPAYSPELTASQVHEARKLQIARRRPRPRRSHVFDHHAAAIWSWLQQEDCSYELVVLLLARNFGIKTSRRCVHYYTATRNPLLAAKRSRSVLKGANHVQA